MQQMLNDPEMMRQMIMANPNMREVIERNPEVSSARWRGNETCVDDACLILKTIDQCMVERATHNDEIVIRLDMLCKTLIFSAKAWK